MGRRPSWKRALGVTKAKRDIARMTGIPTTRSGRKRKAKSTLGCCVPFVLMIVGFVGVGAIGLRWLEL